MAKQHTSACARCPFRRTSAPGWLGADTAEGFIATADSDVRMPCHLHVDYERNDWYLQAMHAPQCAGRAAYLRNRCKMPRDNDLATFVRSVPPDPECFRWPQEFIAHHKRS
jgi:hypothetical protein